METDKEEKNQNNKFSESGTKKPAKTTNEGTEDNNWDAENPIERNLDK